MAEFVAIDKNKYKIVGTLTEEDINKINAFKNRTTLILENTVGLSSELVSKIVSDRVVFSIKGGLDYDTKEKYKEQKYINRTFVSPRGLEKIIKYFEYNERMINPNWNEFEKSMFLYNALVVDMEYAEDYEELQQRIIERSLNGILYGKLVCVGFALVYKEMLDRVGIKNYYQNQKNVHAFNIIEIDGKKYGVDITYDNNAKKNNDGRCGFSNFGHDSKFYDQYGHQLYVEEDLFDDFEINILEKVYDNDEEIYDLSLLSIEQLKEYYSHIVSSINARKPFRYNLQGEPLETRIKYLPVDIVEYKLTKEANEEYSVFAIIQFLKKRNSLKMDESLMKAISCRQGYVMDMASDKNYGSVNLMNFGLEGYEINIDGNLSYDKDNVHKKDYINGVFADQSNVSKQELDELYDHLNQYLSNYLKKYISSIINNLDTLLTNYEYKPNEWDANRAIESANIYSKLVILVNSRDYLIQLGLSEQEVDSIIQRITSKYNEIHKPNESNVSKKDHDLSFLSAVFGDLNMVWQTIEYDLQKQITEEEFISLYSNVDYMIDLFEKYITIAGDEKFEFGEYNISKEDLQQLLNKVMQDYQSQKKARRIS